MPLLFALPLAVGGYALFAGAIANKPEPAPTLPGGSSIDTYIKYAVIAGVGYIAYKKFVK